MNADAWICNNCGEIPELANGRCPWCDSDYVVPAHVAEYRVVTGIEKHFQEQPCLTDLNAQ